MVTEVVPSGTRQRLPRSLKIVIAGGLVSRLGSGLVIPFTLIYLHEVRGIGFAVAGLLLGLLGVTGLAVTPLAGNLIDRVGSVWTIAVALALLAVGYGGLALVTGPVSAGIALGLAGCGNGLFWPSHKTLLASLTEPGRRHVAFSLDQMAANVGIGLGGLLGGLVIAASGSTSAYSLLFAINGLSFLFFIAALPWRSVSIRPSSTVDSAEAAEPADAQVEQPTGWRAVLTNRAMRRLLTVQLLIVMCGVVGLEQLLPVYLNSFAGVPAQLLGAIFTVNVIAYLVLQLPIRRLLEGRDRANALSGGILTWAGLWLVVALGTWFTSGVAALVVGCVAAGGFAVGESVVTLTVDPTVSDISPPHLMGRFMSALTLIWNIGLIAGPVLGGLVMQVLPAAVWPLFAGALIVAAVLARRLHQDLPKGRRTFQSS